MTKFMDENFMLKSETARTLYHNHAAKMPIYDYHCHVNVEEICADKTYGNITQLWLYGDHYKWRAMRLFGIDERLITGDAPDYDKFLAYAGMIPYAIGNPLYHWTHLELQRFFGIYEPLNSETAPEIWKKTSELLAGGLTTRRMITMSNVRAICSTDDPTDDLRWHKKLREDGGFDVKVLPTFRPDKALSADAPDFAAWVGKLGEVCDVKITDYRGLLGCLDARIEYFAATGCGISDHSMAHVPFAPTDIESVSRIFSDAMAGVSVTAANADSYRFFTLKHLAAQYAKRGWVMQLHIGALRANNSVMLARLGPDTGFDSIDDRVIAAQLSKFLDSVNSESLPKTVIYTLNPKDNYVLGAMMGNFADRVQFGTAWWFNDQRDGMLEQLRAFANLGMLSKFVGMLTDSRSFTSYTRHEYFRRILCNLIGGWVEDGEIVDDIKLLGEIVENICYNNISEFMGK